MTVLLGHCIVVFTSDRVGGAQIVINCLISKIKQDRVGEETERENYAHAILPYKPVYLFSSAICS